MKTKKRVLPALLLSLFAAAAAPAANAQQFSGVVVFGDSYSDAGYYRPGLAALGLPSTLVATLGRFTTNPGPVWSELVSQHYGVTPAPSNAGGTIYAQGGARSTIDSPNTPPFATARSITTQINEYMAAHNNAADPRALYTVLGGGNDFLVTVAQFAAGQVTSAQLQAVVLGAATAEVQQVGRLYAAGARYVMVLNYPDPAALPAFAGLDATTRGLLTQLNAGASTTLLSGLATSGRRVIPVDLYTLTNEMRANPSAYGFTNITGMACGAFPPITTAARVSSQFCYSGNLVAANAAQTYMWADSVHPTAATHQIWAQFAEAMIDGPFAYSLLAEAPLSTRASHVRTINDGLASGAQAEVGRLKVFASVDRGNFDIGTGPGVTGLKSNNKSFSVGVTARVSEAATIGAAVGRSKNDGGFGNDMGGFNTSENVVSLFGSMRWAGFYGTGVVSISNLSFGTIQRNIVLGPVVRTATATTSGSNASAYLTAGYDFRVGPLSIGPVLAVSSQNVDVNGFDESGAASSNLHIASQNRRSEVWSAGANVSATVAGWTPWARITADRERRDDPRVVTASPLSLASGNSYDIPAYAPHNSFRTVSLGVRGELMDRVGLAVAWSKVSGRTGIRDDGIAGMLSYRF